jgi:hypothetical protein
MTLSLEGDEAMIVGTFTRLWGDFCLRDTPHARITAWLVVATARNRVAVGLPDLLPPEAAEVAEFLTAHPARELRASVMPLDELRYVGWWSGLVLSAGDGLRRLPPRDG